MTRAMAVLRIAALLLVGLPVIGFTALRRFVAGKRAAGFPVWFARLVCRIIGVRLVIEGRAPARGPALIAANHLSWLDIPVLAAATPLAFVGKRDVADWPLFGVMARLHGSVFVNRERRHSTGPSHDELQERFTAGDVMVLFPEGTSSDGTGVLPFKSSFFAAAERQGVPVYPVTIAHVKLQGLPLGPRQRPLFAWYGDMAMVPHLWGVLQSGPLSVRLRFHDPLHPADFSSRKVLSQHVEELIREDLVLVLAGRR